MTSGDLATYALPAIALFPRGATPVPAKGRITGSTVTTACIILIEES